MAKRDLGSKTLYVTVISDNYFLMEGILHAFAMNMSIKIIPCNTLSFLSRDFFIRGIKIIDMDSWGRFYAASHTSLHEVIDIYNHNSIFLLQSNNMHDIVRELLYPELKNIRSKEFAEGIKRHLMGEAPEPVRLLTPRQRQVTLLMSSGMDYEETCSLLGISAKTLSVHLRSVLRKVSIKKFSHFCAAIAPYAQDFSAARPWVK